MRSLYFAHYKVPGKAVSGLVELAHPISPNTWDDVLTDLARSRGVEKEQVEVTALTSLPTPELPLCRAVAPPPAFEKDSPEEWAFIEWDSAYHRGLPPEEKDVDKPFATYLEYHAACQAAFAAGIEWKEGGGE